jgi:hypothetical protein
LFAAQQQKMGEHRELGLQEARAFHFCSLAQSRLSPLRSQWTPPALCFCFHPFPPFTPFVDEYKKETFADDIIKLPAALNNNCALPLPRRTNCFSSSTFGYLPHLHTVCPKHSKHAAFLNKTKWKMEKILNELPSSFNAPSCTVASIDFKKIPKKQFPIQINRFDR